MTTISRTPVLLGLLCSSILLLSTPTWADAPHSLPDPTRLTVDDGTWRPIPPPEGRVGHDAVYDPVRRRMLVIGGTGTTNLNDVWEMNLDGPPQWNLVQPAGTPPSARFHHTTIYDPVRDRVVYFGGGGGISGRSTETWELALSGTPTWSLIATATSPEARWMHSAIYDPIRDRMIVFGGHGSSAALNDVWALSLSGTPQWTALAPSGTAPLPREAHSATYDPLRDRMIVFGGWSPNGNNYLNDTWTLDFAPAPAWTQLSPSGATPGPHFFHTASYDPYADRMLVFGGGSSGFPPPNPTHYGWSLDLSGSPSWSAQLFGGSAPPARSDHTAAYDPIGGRLVVFGGAAPNVPFNDTWALSLVTGPTWSQLTPVSLTATGHGAVHDPVRDQMVVVTFNSQVWTYSLGGSQSWTRIFPAGTGPPALTWDTGYPDDRPDFSLVYDSARERVLLYGGGTRSGVWALSLSGTPAWSSIVPTGGPPAARSSHSAIYDPLRDRMLVFGGLGGSAYRNEVWQLSLAGTPAWTLLTPTGTLPPVRAKHTAIYDPVRDRMVIHGGGGAMSGGPYAPTDNLSDAWVLDLSGPLAWTALSSAGAPSPRSDHTAIYDPVRERMVVYGGVFRDFYLVRSTYTQSDVWALALAGTPTWTRLTPAGPPSQQRFAHSSIYDPTRDRMIVLGGESDYSFTRNDATSLVFSDTPTAVTVSLIGAQATGGLVRLAWHSALGQSATVSRRSESEPWRILATLSPDGSGRFHFEDHDALPGRRYGYRIEIEGADGSRATDETWIDLPLEPRLELAGLIPNPSRGPMTVTFTLPDARPAQIELIDASGRRVLLRSVEAEAGRQVLRMAPAGRVPPGIYFLRLRQGTEQRTRRCSVIE